MGFLDKIKQTFSGAKTDDLKAKAQDVARKADAKAEELSRRNGAVGKVAGKAHEVIDKVDGD